MYIWQLEHPGFDLECTGITQAARLERLFGLVILAWVSCLRIGIWLARQRPIKVKGHGQKALSLVRYGAEILVNVLRWNSGGFSTPIATSIQSFPTLSAVGSNCPLLRPDSIH